MSLRALVSSLVCIVFISACSRTYDVDANPVLVSPDEPDCSIAPLASPVVNEIKLVSKGADLLEAQVLYKAQSLVASSLSETLFLEPASNLFFVYLDVLDAEEDVSLADGSIAEVASVTALIADNNNQTGPVTVDNRLEVPFEIVSSTSEIDVNFEISYRFEETRSECEFLGVVITDEVTDPDGNVEEISRVLRTLSESFEINFTIDRSPYESSIETSQANSNSDIEDKKASSVSGTGLFLAVGVPGNDGGDTSFVPASDAVSNTTTLNSGAVQLYQRDLENGSLEFCGLVKASNARENDAFGSNVLVRGDYLYVYASGEDSDGVGAYSLAAAGLNLNYSQFDSGAVYVYEISNSCVAQEVGYIKNPDNALNIVDPKTGFGSALAEFNGELFVGAPQQREIGGSARQLGKVYQFFRESGNTWRAQTNTYQHIFEHSGQAFGASLAVNDRFLLVGVPNDAASPSDLALSNGRASDLQDLIDNPVAATLVNSGSALLFNKASLNGTPVVKDYLKPSFNDQGDRFGSSVALAGTTLFVGAPLEDSNSSVINTGENQNNAPVGGGPLDGNYGAVYQYMLDEFDALSISNYIKAKQPLSGANFGEVIAAENRYLVIGQPSASFELNSSTIPAHVEIYDHQSISEAPVYLSVYDDEQALGGSVLNARVKSLSLFAGMLAIGLPEATIDGDTNAGAFAIWD
ncbi:FG-GAP repeat protein [Oleiphilus sp. HI0066]|uniref:FG-GAP repeat protein n=2 Tax=Oleiphilus sp. HI0066 TaxID=1822242 RepID=UPI000B2DA261|nr:FG-GAP repeat protein [Oleiphilus sp. HI0066]